MLNLYAAASYAIARKSIRQTITNYTIAGDNRDAALFDALWAEDALFEFEFPPLPGFRCKGIEEIAKTYFIVMTDIGPDHAGTYTDKLVRQGGPLVLRPLSRGSRLAFAGEPIVHGNCAEVAVLLKQSFYRFLMKSTGQY